LGVFGENNNYNQSMVKRLITLQHSFGSVFLDKKFPNFLKNPLCHAKRLQKNNKKKIIFQKKLLCFITNLSSQHSNP